LPPQGELERLHPFDQRGLQLIQAGWIPGGALETAEVVDQAVELARLHPLLAQVVAQFLRRLPPHPEFTGELTRVATGIGARRPVIRLAGAVSSGTTAGLLAILPLPLALALPLALLSLLTLALTLPLALLPLLTLTLTLPLALLALLALTLTLPLALLALLALALALPLTLLTLLSR
jgi:hypothetical protein